MNRFAHGGDIYSRHIEHDFSSNINPLGLPDEVLLEISDSLWRCGNYPDPSCRELIRAISDSEWFPSGRIVCGNGAADLIYRIVSAFKPRRALVCAPTFSEYEKALTEHGCAIRQHFLSQENDFRLTCNILSDIASDIDILFLCNPNNPTGHTIPPELMERISAKCRETGTFLVVDECFLDFVEGGRERSARQFLSDNSAILKAFTKIYAMPGIRLGYALFGSSEVAEKAASTGQAWSVSTPAQAAGIAALRLDGYVEKPWKSSALSGNSYRTVCAPSGWNMCRPRRISYCSAAGFRLTSCFLSAESHCGTAKITTVWNPAGSARRFVCGRKTRFFSPRSGRC